MKIKREEVIELMKVHFKSNYNKFAYELKVDPSHLHRCLNTGEGGGKKIIGAIMRYCKDNNLDYEEYIEI